MTGVGGRLSQISLMDKLPNLITYKFKRADGKQVSEKELLHLLQTKFQLLNDSPAIEVVKGKTKEISKSCIAFNFPELFLNKMEHLENNLKIQGSPF